VKSLRLDPEVAERFENAIEACSGAPLHLDEATAAERFLARGTRELERKQNDGKPFEPSRRLRAKRRERELKQRRRRQTT